MFGVSSPTVAKAVREIGRNGNGHASAAIVDLDGVVGWWRRASDAERTTFVRSVGINTVWRAIEGIIG
jgi:hypothetical protein